MFHPLVARVVEELVRRLVFDNLALVEHHDAVGHLPGKAQLVGYGQYRHLRFGQLAHHLQHLFDHLRVQGRGRLVKEHDVGLHGQGAGDGHALLLTARELGRVFVGLFGYPHPFQQFRRDPLCFVGGQFADFHGSQRDVAHHRQVGEQVERLEDHAHVPADGVNVAHVVGQLNAIYNDVAPLVLLQAVDGADKGGLARSRRAYNDHHFAFLDGGSDAAQGMEIAVPLVHVAADDDLFCGGSISVGSHGALRWQ